jgi:hypothetical protein
MLKFIIDHRGVPRYFNKEQRQQIASGKLTRSGNETIDNADHHSAICSFYGVPVDFCAKYCYYPATGELVEESIGKFISRFEPEEVKAWCESIDWRSITPTKTI